jgi:hypothetical protein
MRLALLAVTVAVAGCGSPDGHVTFDGPSALDADMTATCLVKGSYDTLPAIAGTAGTVQGATTLTFVLDPGPPGKDDLFFRLVPNKGAFASGLVPGTYTIGGVDASYATCGLCTNLIADITTSGPTKFYFASSGTVTLDTVTPPIMGAAQNLAFTEIDITSGMTDGPCVSKVASVVFTAQ